MNSIKKTQVGEKAKYMLKLSYILNTPFYNSDSNMSFTILTIAN